MKKKDILTLLIPSFLVVVAWVIFSIYHSFVTSTIPESLNMQITAINPEFDTSVIENLKKREKVTPIYEAEANPSIAPIDIEEDISPPISTDSGQIATSEGELSP